MTPNYQGKRWVRHYYISVLFFVIVSTAQGAEVKVRNTTKPLSYLFIMFPGIGIMSTMFIFIDFIYVCMHKVSKNFSIQIVGFVN